MSEDDDYLSNLLRSKLKVETKYVGQSKLQKELDLAGFSIFESISDHGYFSWKPVGSYVSLSDVPSEYIKKHTNLEGKPEKLVRTNLLRLPHRFPTLPPLEFMNEFPYGQIDVACLHVASKHRKVNMKSMDFAFGGSTLQMLANKDVSDPFCVTKIPGTNVIMIVKSKQYEENYADVGFQFERFVVGKAMPTNTKSISFTEHVHVMKVGGFNVLFRAETDALDDVGDPVEITFSNPRYWETKKMFQMISSGSTKLCAGVKERGVNVTRVDLQPLSKVARDGMRNFNIRTLEENILNGMRTLTSEIDEKSDDNEGQVYRISFVGGKLKLTSTNVEILPPPKVVRELV